MIVVAVRFRFIAIFASVSCLTPICFFPLRMPLFFFWFPWKRIASTGEILEITFIGRFNAIQTVMTAAAAQSTRIGMEIILTCTPSPNVWLSLNQKFIKAIEIHVPTTSPAGTPKIVSIIPSRNTSFFICFFVAPSARIFPYS